MPPPNSMLGPMMLGAGLGILGQNTARPYWMGPPSIGRGIMQGLPMGLSLYSALNQPAEPRETRTLQIGGDKVTQEYNPNTGQWVEIARGPAWQPRAKKPPKPPHTRTVIRGGRTITEQFDPKTGGFTEIGSGPRWEPDKPDEGAAFAALFPGVDPKRPMGYQAQAYLRLLDEKLQRGETLTERERRDAMAARAIVNQERLYLDQQTGDITAIKPEVAPWMQSIGAPEATTAPVGTQPTRTPLAAATPEQRVRTMSTGAGRNRKAFEANYSRVYQSIAKVDELLDLGEKLDSPYMLGDATTGLEGAARRTFGGLQRQIQGALGMEKTPPVAEDLAREYKLLQFYLTPMLTQESSRFSGAERAQVDAVLADLQNPLTDATEIAAAMVRIVDVMELLKEAYK